MKASRLTNFVKSFFLGTALFILFSEPLPFSLAVDTGQQPSQPQEPVNVARGRGASLNWSGYMVADGTYTGVSGTWVIPKLKVDNNSFGVDATWVGVGGVTNRDLIQAGTQTAVSPNGDVSYEAFYEVLPDYSRPLAIDINGGDSVTVTLNQESPNQWLITFINNTSGKRTQLKQTYESSLSSAEWIEEAPSSARRILPLNNFGTIQFSDARAVKDGKIINLAEAKAQSVVMADFSGQVLAFTSDLGNDGASFSIQRTDYQTEVPWFRQRSFFD